MKGLFSHIQLVFYFSASAIPCLGLSSELIRKSCVNHGKNSNASFHLNMEGLQNHWDSNSCHEFKSCSKLCQIDTVSFVRLQNTNTRINFHFYCHFQNIHVSFLRTVPPSSHQANVFQGKILRHFLGHFLGQLLGQFCRQFG